MDRSENTKVTSILHELGHCDLNRNHEPKEAESIMSIFHVQQLSLQGIDINEDLALKKEIYEELFSARGDFGEKYIEGQLYPIGLTPEDAELCPTKTRLYLDEI